MAVEAVIVESDLTQDAHQQAFLALMDEYVREPIIRGEPLAAQTRKGLIDEMRRRKGLFVLLAFCAGEPAGFAVCLVGFSTFAGKPLVNVHDLAVTAKFRGQKVGWKLLEQIEAKARELGCCKITLEVSESNHRARALYRKFGFGGDEVILFETKLLL